MVIASRIGVKANDDEMKEGARATDDDGYPRRRANHIFWMILSRYIISPRSRTCTGVLAVDDETH